MTASPDQSGTSEAPNEAPTAPNEASNAPVMDADEARDIVFEMVAVVRTLFGSAAAQHAQQAQQSANEPQAQPAQELTLQPAIAAVVESYPAPQAAPLTSVPMPTGIPVQAIAITVPDAIAPEPQPESESPAPPARRPFVQEPTIHALPVPALVSQVETAAPERRSMALLHEIAFLDD